MIPLTESYNPQTSSKIRNKFWTKEKEPPQKKEIK